MLHILLLIFMTAQSSFSRAPDYLEMGEHVQIKMLFRDTETYAYKHVEKVQISKRSKK